MKINVDLSKVVKITIISTISIILIIAITNMLFPSNAINLHEQACMSLANQMIENMEESNFDTEKFAKINDLLFSRMINEQCTDTEGWKKIVSYSPEN
jgi:competence protein ComGC